MKYTGFKPSCALIAEETKDIEPVNGIEGITSLSPLVPEDPQIIAASGTALIAAERAPSTGALHNKESRYASGDRTLKPELIPELRNIAGKKTVLTSRQNIATY